MLLNSLSPRLYWGMICKFANIFVKWTNLNILIQINTMKMIIQGKFNFSSLRILIHNNTNTDWNLEPNIQTQTCVCSILGTVTYISTVHCYTNEHKDLQSLQILEYDYGKINFLVVFYLKNSSKVALYYIITLFNADLNVTCMYKSICNNLHEYENTTCLIEIKTLR